MQHLRANQGHREYAVWVILSWQRLENSLLYYTWCVFKLLLYFLIKIVSILFLFTSFDNGAGTRSKSLYAFTGLKNTGRGWSQTLTANSSWNLALSLAHRSSTCCRKDFLLTGLIMRTGEKYTVCGRGGESCARNAIQQQYANFSTESVDILYGASTVVCALVMQTDLLEWFPVAEQPGRK